MAAPITDVALGLDDETISRRVTSTGREHLRAPHLRLRQERQLKMR